MYPGAGYIVAFPNPHGSTGYGQEFTAEISRDWGGKVYQDVMAVVDSLANLSYVDKDRMGAMGWSYGGYMMMWLEGHTDRFKAIACMMGMYDLTAMYGTTEELWFPQWDLNGTPWTSDLYQKWSPNNFVKNFKTPCLVITGEQDYRVPYTQSLEFFTDLQKMGVASRLIVFKNDGHWPSGITSMPLYYNAHLDWFHKYLGGDPAPYDMLKMVRNQAFESK
jgi:dipeptidyl aminopeptidase/acylaminoacyl peptidase